MKEGLFYNQIGQDVICNLCPHHCRIKEGEVGRCGVRQVISGKLYALNYGVLSSIAVDPIEKKPLNQWRQGTDILSVGSYGCNMSCLFCQNSSISMDFGSEGLVLPQRDLVEPKDIVSKALELDLHSIAYTYNEPTVYYEFVLETARLAKAKGLANVLVSNGYIEEGPFKQLAPMIDAMNIDVKTYDPHKYKTICGGRLEPVIQTIERAIEHKIHVELTYLIVPELNDELEAYDEFFHRIYQRCGDVFIHISRYFPRYHYDKPATNIQLMMEIQRIARRYFSQVMLGNVR